MTDLNYARYVRVPELLGLQRARSGSAEPLVQAAEHLFIVTHQSSELWLSQVLLDLDEAGTALDKGRYPDAEECLHRCVSVLDLLTETLDVLATMPPRRFAGFRGALGRASGAQSGQFAGLDRRLGLRGRSSPLLDAFLSACERERVTPVALLRDGVVAQPELARVALLMLDVARKTWKWKVSHLELTAKMIGHQRTGTGGSSGTRYLAGRLAMPFGPLWDAVSDVQRQAG